MNDDERQMRYEAGGVREKGGERGRGVREDDGEGVGAREEG